MRKFARVMKSLERPSPQWWFGCSTGLFFSRTCPSSSITSASPVPLVSNGSAKARFVGSRCRYSPKSDSEPRPIPTPAPPLTSIAVPSSGKMRVAYRPTSAFTNGVNGPSLSTRFTTPAIASEPYWADAPSRNTSIRSIAPAGSALRSTPLDPAPMPYANVLTRAVWWRRQPFTVTRVWSGLSPRRVNGRTMSFASVTLCRGKLTEGESAWRICPVSVVPWRSITSAVNTSTGTASSSAAVCRARDPTTTLIGASCTAARTSAKFWIAVSPARIVTRMLCDSYPMDRARTLWVPAGTLRKLYSPARPVAVWSAVPCTCTVAPETGRPAVSLTTPRSTAFCACATCAPLAAATNAARTEQRARRMPSPWLGGAERVGAGGRSEIPRSPRCVKRSGRADVPDATQDAGGTSDELCRDAAGSLDGVAEIEGEGQDRGSCEDAEVEQTAEERVRRSRVARLGPAANARHREQKEQQPAGEQDRRLDPVAGTVGGVAEDREHEECGDDDGQFRRDEMEATERHRGAHALLRAVAAGHRRRGQHHQHDEHRLHRARPREPRRCTGVDWAAASARPPPPHERRHGRDFQDENGAQKRELQPEDVVARVVPGRLLDAAEPAPESRRDPQGCGRPPPDIRGKHPPEAGGVERLPERPRASEYGTETDAEREKVSGGEQPAERQLWILLKPVLERARRTRPDRCHDTLRGVELRPHPAPPAHVEHRRKRPKTYPRVYAEIGIECDHDPLGLVDL